MTVDSSATRKSLWPSARSRPSVACLRSSAAASTWAASWAASLVVRQTRRAMLERAGRALRIGQIKGHQVVDDRLNASTSSYASA